MSSPLGRPRCHLWEWRLRRTRDRTSHPPEVGLPPARTSTWRRPPGLSRTWRVEGAGETLTSELCLAHRLSPLQAERGNATVTHRAQLAQGISVRARWEIGVRATQLLGRPRPSGPGWFSCSPGRGPPSPSNTKYMTVSRKATAPAITSKICQTCTSSPPPGAWGRAGPGPGGVAHARACLTAPHRRTSSPWATSRVRWENSNFAEVNHHVRRRVRRQPFGSGWPPGIPPWCREARPPIASPGWGSWRGSGA